MWLVALIVSSILGTASRLSLIRADNFLRYCGLMLQLAGMLTVVFGLRDKGRLFERPSLVASVRRWLQRRPRWGAMPQTVMVAGTGSFSLSGSARLSVWHGVPADASLEARMHALEANVATLREEYDQNTQECHEAMKKTNDALTSERRERQATVGRLQEQVEKLGAGGLHLELMGVVCLFLGVVLATISKELAALVSR